MGSKVLVSKRRELRDQVGKKNRGTWRFLEWVHDPMELDYLKTTFENNSEKLQIFFWKKHLKLPESESIICLNWCSEFWKQTTICYFVAWTLPTKDDLGMRPTRCCKAGFSEVRLRWSWKKWRWNDNEWQIFEKIFSFDIHFRVYFWISESMLRSHETIHRIRWRPFHPAFDERNAILGRPRWKACLYRWSVLWITSILLGSFIETWRRILWDKNDHLEGLETGELMFYHHFLSFTRGSWWMAEILDNDGVFYQVFMMSSTE